MQVRGTKTCLEALGPWPAAVAATYDLLSAVPEEDATGGLGSGSSTAGGRGGLVDLELAKMMSDDDLGKPPAEMIELLR